jgi:hypothetical protein
VRVHRDLTASAAFSVLVRSGIDFVSYPEPGNDQVCGTCRTVFSIKMKEVLS